MSDAELEGVRRLLGTPTTLETLVSLADAAYDLLAELNRVKAERALSDEALGLARAALGDDDKPFLDDAIRSLKAERDRLRDVCQRLRAGWLPHRLSAGSWWWGRPREGSGFYRWSEGSVPSMSVVDPMTDAEVVAWTATLHPYASEAEPAALEGKVWEPGRDELVEALRHGFVECTAPCSTCPDIVALLDRLGEPTKSLTLRHQEHYCSCNCLGDSAECCVPSCDCHVGEPTNG